MGNPDMDGYLSAALEDAEGKALVQDIIARKENREAIQYFTANRIMTAPLGEALDGAEVINGFIDGLRMEMDTTPALPEMPEPWGSQPVKIPARVEMSFPLVDLSDDFIDLLMGEEPGTWASLKEEQQKLRDAAERWSEYPIVHKVPEVGEVRWVCKPPTAPAYREGSLGWMMEQMEARITPTQREYNRKLNPRVAQKVSAIHEILGVTQHDTNDSEVP